MLERLADELGTGLYCSSGFNTLSAKYEAASTLIEHWDRGTVIVFVGDLDPWGEARYLNVRADVLALAADRIAAHFPRGLAVSGRSEHQVRHGGADA